LAVHYGAGVGVADFQDERLQSIAAIDHWISRQTNQKIEGLLRDVDLPELVDAILVNAAYFHGTWAKSFDSELTSPQTFTRLDGSGTVVEMMSNALDMAYAEGPDFQAAALRYAVADGREFEMVVILPTQNFVAFDTALDASKLQSIVNSFAPEFVALTLPRFRLRTKLRLKQTLAQLGMSRAFSGGFTEMTDPPLPAGIHEVVHEGFIDVTESGTEAAAATAVIIGQDGSADPVDQRPIIILRIDRPFIYLIRERQSKTVLFLGRMVDPAALSN
jgi:serpin B